MPRGVARADPTRKTFKAKRARVNKGSDECPEVRCLLAGGPEVEERGAIGRALCTPKLIIAKLLSSIATERGLTLMLLGVKCAFLHGSMWRNIYSELPRQDLGHGDGGTTGKLRKAAYGTCDAPQF